MSDVAQDVELNAAYARVEENPTDLQYRFLLGECLFRLGRHAEAIPELQRAKMNPKTRAAAMKLLAESFTILGDKKQAEGILRQLDSEYFDDEDESGSSPSPSPTKPVNPTTTPAMNRLPENDTKND